MPPPLRAAARLGITYRAATHADLPFLARLYASTRTEELAVTGWPDALKHKFLTQQFDAQHRHYRAHYPAAEWLVIKRGGEAIGRLYLEEWANEFRIIDIALWPAACGVGIGGAILADVLAQADRVGKGVSIHVEKNNRARSLYDRLGFVLVDEHGVYDLLIWRGRADRSS
jgi:ribosomal protein S18 acetylase RimI-like enzyme